MNTKTKTDKTPAAPVDERKQFIVAAYSTRGNKLALSHDARSGETITTVEQAKTVAQDMLTRYAHSAQHYGGHYEGIMIFESIGIIRPKKVEVEAEEIKRIG